MYAMKSGLRAFAVTIIAEPLGLATQGNIDFVHHFWSVCHAELVIAENERKTSKQGNSENKGIQIRIFILKKGFSLIAEPLGLATQEKMDFGLIFATSTNNFLSYNIGHPRNKLESKWGKAQMSDSSVNIFIHPSYRC